uniref:Proliferating cell nuclear antigen PCNA N-terminal domain-containing protein n=1 Tax=viral metagenome TaxID=1070528 RepID=A0A6C0KGD5_9ZZZZ
MPATKRRKQAPMEWSANFDNRSDLERIVKAVREMGMPNVTMSFKKQDDFEGMRSEVKNSSLTCLLRVQLECEVLDANNPLRDHVVTVACDSFLGVLRGSGKPQFRLQLAQYEGDTSLIVKSFDTFDRSFTSSTTLQTMVEDETEPLPLNELSFQWLLRMDLNFFKSLIKNNKDLGCETVDISILESVGMETALSVVRFVCETTNISDTKELVSLAPVSSEDGHKLLDMHEEHVELLEVPEEDQLERKMHMKLDLSLLYQFVKSMDQRGKLKMMMNEDDFLLFKIDMATENSFIYYLQCSKVGSDDEDDEDDEDN